MSRANHVPLSPLSFLARARRAFPGKVAVVDADGTEVSYETLGRDCDAMAGALRARGIQPGERVAVLDYNTRWLLAAHYGVPGAGAALVALNSRLAAAEYRDILAHCRARVLLLSPALLPALGVSAADQLPVETVVMLGAPVVLSDLARAGRRRGFTAGRLVRAAVGGAPPTKETIAAVRQMGFEVTHLYGLTETYGPSLVCEYQQGWADLPAETLAEKLSRQGVPTVSVGDVRVADERLAAVPADGRTVGEILVRSNTVAAGYLDDEQATAEAFAGSWFHTGDLAVLHPDGYIELTDRSKDVIISGGENIASVEVEKVLAAHPKVLEAAVVAVPDRRWGERPVAFVTPADGSVTEQELTEFVRARPGVSVVPGPDTQPVQASAPSAADAREIRVKRDRYEQLVRNAVRELTAPGQQRVRLGRQMDQRTLPAHIVAGAAAHDGCPLTFVGADGVTEFETTLGALVSDAARVAGALQARGIGPGHVVAVQLPGSYEGAVAQAAVSMCGAVLLPVVMIYGPREMGFLLRQSVATAVFVPRAYRGREHASVVLGGLPDLPALQFAVVVGDDAPPYGAVSYADLAGRLAAPYRRPAPDPDDRAMLVYTSGTTADPKGVQHSHRSLLAEATSRVIRDSGPRARQLGLFPPGHIAGLLSLLRLLLQAIPTITMETWDPAVAARLIDRYHVTASVGAPIQLSGLLDQQASGTASLATLREFMTGAAAVPPNLIRRADAAGITAYRTYGSSEHPTISTGTVADSLGKRATTDGMLIAGNEIRIIDSDGKDVPAGREGEIASRGPELFIGYTDPALDAQAFLPGGWYRTGDVGRLDADGYLTITDRLKDIIIRGGENISSAEVEDLLITHPAIAEVAVIPAPDPAVGERVCAVVVPAPGLSFGLDEARAHFAAAGVARQKTPEVIIVVAELPRTPSGKVRKEMLRAQLAASPARQSG